MADKRGHPFKVLSAVTDVTGALSRFDLLLLVMVIWRGTSVSKEAVTHTGSLLRRGQGSSLSNCHKVNSLPGSSISSSSNSASG